jgi:AraC-like DNA-binding protein
MVDKPLPRDVWVARDLLCADLSRAWRVSDLARMCAVPRRSLEKHFRHFLGCTPLKLLQAERLGEARRKLLRAPLSATVTRIAIECGFPHLGRFAIAYRDHFGESPSATLRFSRARVRAQSCAAHWPCIDRPSIAVLPFERNGLHGYRAVRLSDEIGAAPGRIGWVILADAPILVITCMVASMAATWGFYKSERCYLTARRGDLFGPIPGTMPWPTRQENRSG